MFPLEERRRPAHRFLIERKRIVQHVALLKRWNNLPAVDAVLVGLGQGIPTRLEIGTLLFAAQHADGRRQQRVEGAQKLLRRKARLRLETGGLGQRVHARIRATRSQQEHPLAGEPRGHIHQRALDGRVIWLQCPAMKIRAVVGQRQANVAHRSTQYRTFPAAATRGSS